MFDEKYYRSQFDTVPSGDLLEYYIINGIDEDKAPCAFFDNDYFSTSIFSIKIKFKGIDDILLINLIHIIFYLFYF